MFARSPSAVLLTSALLIACGAKPSEPAPPLVDEVNPFIGSGGEGFGVGSIQPGPKVPFGFAKPGADTSINNGRAPGFSHCGGYWWEDDEIRGFSQLHLSGTGAPDYGVLMVMPMGEAPAGNLSESSYRASFDHRRESAAVGRYRVTLLPAGIDVEIGATRKTSVYRFTFPAGPQHVVVNLAHGIASGRTTAAHLEVDAGARELSGWLHHRGQMTGGFGGYRLYFVMRFDRAFEATLLDRGARREPTTRALESEDAGALVAFDPAGGATVGLQIGLSFVDLETARAHLEAEWAAFDLDAVQARAVAEWTPILEKIRIAGGTPAQRRIFYTALYHSFMMPTDLTEAGRRYRGVDGEVHTASDFTYYSDLSLWDTFRTLHPLLALIAPEHQADINRTLLEMTEASGRIPKWPLATGETNVMIAHHGESVLVDSYLRGVGGFDPNRAYSFLRAAAQSEESSLRKRDCATGYLARGYCALDEEGGATSKTLENAFSDFVLSRFARALGHEDDAARFAERAGSWRHLVDARAARIRGKRADGSFPEVFNDELFSEDLVEGNVRQWTTFVPHDVPGLAEAMGGPEVLLGFLTRLFEEAAAAEPTVLPELWYWHGNQPDIHAAYMFAELGRPELTERWVDWIRRERYGAGPDGLAGNDDGGTLSAWYVFSALGFYPKIGEARYVLGTPLFPEAVLELGAGRQLRIVAEGWAEGAIHVAEVRLDGRTLEGPFIDHAELVAARELVFEMSATPGRR